MNENGRRQTIPERSMETTLLVEYLSAHDGLITDEELSKACGRNVKTDAAGNLQTAIRAERKSGRTWLRVREKGYQLATPSDAPAVAKASVGKVHRESARALERIGGCGDLSKMTTEERIRTDAAASALAAINQFTRTRSVKRLEAASAQKGERLLLGETLKQFGIGDNGA